MRNVTMSTSGNKLTITVDLAVDGTISRTGKSTILASTEGNVGAPDRPEVKIGLNVYKPRS